MSPDVLVSQSEADPTGKSPHEPGAKLDAGKPRPGLVMSGFARALGAVTAVGTYGAAKYTDNGWMQVPDGIARYTDAMHRHLLAEAMGEAADPESSLLHAAHAAWGALARLDLMLRAQEQAKAPSMDDVHRANRAARAAVNDACNPYRVGPDFRHPRGVL